MELKKGHKLKPQSPYCPFIDFRQLTRLQMISSRQEDHIGVSSLTPKKSKTQRLGLPSQPGGATEAQNNVKLVST